MKNTSAGYHTFSFYQKVNSDDYSMLINDFVMYRHKNDNIKDFPIKDKDGKTIGWEYTYKKKRPFFNTNDANLCGTFTADCSVNAI